MGKSFFEWAKQDKNKKFVLLIIVLIFGVILFTFKPYNNNSSLNMNTSAAKKISTNNQTISYEDKLEKKLRAILSDMEGVGSVEVMITTVSTQEKIIARNEDATENKVEEIDKTGGSRVTSQSQKRTDVVLQNGNVPYVTREEAPEIKGVIILAEGAGDSSIKSQITDAVSKVLDVPVHKISVEKKKN